ncbi:hypothetical protein E4T56_gene20723, partial [Termitomyces sp. T112]
IFRPLGVDSHAKPAQVLSSPSSSLLPIQEAQPETKTKTVSSPEEVDTSVADIFQPLGVDSHAKPAQVLSSPSSSLLPIQEAQPETKTKTVSSPEEVDTSVADIFQPLGIDSHAQPAQVLSSPSSSSLPIQEAQPETKTKTVSSPEEVDTSVADIFQPLGIDSHAKPAQVLSSPSSSLLPIQEAQPETKTKTSSPEEVDTSVADIFQPLGVDSHAQPAQVLSSPSSSLLPIQEAQPETKTKTVSSPEEVDTSVADMFQPLGFDTLVADMFQSLGVDASIAAMIQSLGVNSYTESEDAAFLAQVFEDSAAAEHNLQRVLNKVRLVFKEKYGPKYRVEPFGSSR